MTNKTKEYSFVLYGRKTCPYCRLADELIKKIKEKKTNIKYKFMDIEKSRNKKILENDGSIPKTYLFVPKIKVNEKFIGGFDSLTEYSKKTFNL